MLPRLLKSLKVFRSNYKRINFVYDYVHGSKTQLPSWWDQTDKNGFLNKRLWRVADGFFNINGGYVF